MDALVSGGGWTLSAPITLPWLEADGALITAGTESTAWEMDGIRWLRLGPIFPDNPRGDRGEQARQTWLRAQAALADAGFAFSDVVRTWLYVDDILAWYESFNRVRDAFFSETGVDRRRLPASTAVGVPTLGRGAFALHVLAAQGAGMRAQRVDSPLQGPAPDYGSGFSRAVEVQTPARRILLVSGTASIDASGATTFPDDLSAQAGETRRVLEALLESRGFSTDHVTRALLYGNAAPTWRNALDVPAWMGLPVDAQVCRNDLLFEVELDAVRKELVS